MIKKLLLIVIFGIIYNFLFAQIDQNLCKKANLLTKVVNQYHYCPSEINKQFTSNVINNLMQMLDPQALFFTKSDVIVLQQEQEKLKEYLQTNSCNFLNLVTNIYKARLIEADSIISQAMSKPFNLSVNDSIIFDNYKNLQFAENNPALKEKWLKWLKFETLKQLFNQVQYDSLVFNEKTEVLLTRVPEAMTKVKFHEKKIIKKILLKPEGFENFTCNIILNAIAQSFDPHTEYFSNTDKTNFENLLSKESESFGFYIEESKNGEFIISKIKPGGPAWKSHKLQKGDILIEASTNGRPKLDFLNTDFYEANEYLFLSEIKSVELKIKHSNGTIEIVNLLKEKLNVDQNQINSYIIKGKKNIGYLALPDFYRGDNLKTLGCSNDVAKELLKLKKDKIDGLIIDVRYNGGGDLNEANQLAGLFIDEGPFSIIRDRFSKLTLIKDIFRGTIYDDPILLMINGQSASASEVLAGTLQDYNRAIIFGSQSFGKATAQVILPLETTAKSSSNEDSKPNLEMGFVKLTINKLYRITGESHQRKGITPDIQITFPYDRISEKEEDYKTALLNDSINKKVAYKGNPPLPLKYLKDKSTDRVNANVLFKKINDIKNESVNSSYLVKGLSLQINSFKKSISRVNDILNQIDKLPKKVSTEFIVKCNYLNDELKISDNYLSDIVLEEEKNILKDIYIEEAYNIITDFINYKNNITLKK